MIERFIWDNWSNFNSNKYVTNKSFFNREIKKKTNDFFRFWLPQNDPKMMLWIFSSPHADRFLQQQHYKLNCEAIKNCLPLWHLHMTSFSALVFVQWNLHLDYINLMFSWSSYMRKFVFFLHGYLLIFPASLNNKKNFMCSLRRWRKEMKPSEREREIEAVGSFCTLTIMTASAHSKWVCVRWKL